MAVFIVFRAIMGFAGITFLICGRAVIADIIPPERRGIAVSLMTSGPTLGPTIGPIIGGAIAQSIGWRWIFWITIMALGALMLAFVGVLRETYPPIVKARFETPQKSGRKAWFVVPSSREEQSSRFRIAFTRPIRFLVRTRLVPLFALYTSILNSYLAILLATLGTTFESVYDFSPTASGLAYLGMFTGFLLAEFSMGWLSDALLARHRRRRSSRSEDGDRGNEEASPEARLPPMLLGAALLPPALLLYGWTLKYQLQWMAPIVGSGLVAFTTMYCYIPVQVYIMDVYTLHAASATGAMSIVRSAISAVVPLGADPLYARLGYGWGFTLLAAIAIPFFFIGMWLVRSGKRIRDADRAVN